MQLRGADHPCWRGGLRRLANGYFIRYAPDHPRANPQTKTFYEHVLVAEKALGRYLPYEHPVHHVDQDRGNNANSNLVICENNAYHRLLHQRQRAYDACGDANAKRCFICHTYERQDDIREFRTGAYRHASCHAQRERERQYRDAKRALWDGGDGRAA